MLFFLCLCRFEKIEKVNFSIFFRFFIKNRFFHPISIKFSLQRHWNTLEIFSQHSTSILQKFHNDSRVTSHTTDKTTKLSKKRAKSSKKIQFFTDFDENYLISSVFSIRWKIFSRGAITTRPGLSKKLQRRTKIILAHVLWQWPVFVF